MFDKNHFSIILSDINNTYETMTDFASKANFDRTYISKYMNKKLDNPPTPKILKKIADASNGIVTYLELMMTCGHIDRLTLPDQIISEENKDINLKDELNNRSEQKKMEYAQKMLDYMEENNLERISMVPIYGKIPAGEPALAQQYIEGYMPTNPNIIKDNNIFYLKVEGDSMNQKFQDGDYVLIRRQEGAEDGDIVAVLVNGYDATIKRFKQQDNLVILEPMSTNPEHQVQIYDTTKMDIKIIGKAISYTSML